MLCAITASALSYASPYKGAGRSGYVYTTAHPSMASANPSLSQAPTPSMRSTATMYNRDIASANTDKKETSQIHVMQTFASSISGGVTTAETYHQIGPARSKKSDPLPPDACTECKWVWDEVRGCYVCIMCGSNSDDGCDHLYYEGYCWCPIGDGWEVWFFVTALAGAYALYKARARKEQSI